MDCLSNIYCLFTIYDLCMHVNAGSKKHPLSPYSYNKTSEYHVQLREDINKLFREEFFDGHGSPAWAFDISKEITHSGESPFHVHGLLSTSKVRSQSSKKKYSLYVFFYQLIISLTSISCQVFYTWSVHMVLKIYTYCINLNLIDLVTNPESK